MMRFRVIALAAFCGALGWGGYSFSVHRGAQSEPLDVLAAAGSEPGFVSGGEGSTDNEDYRISSLTVFSNVALHVKDNYVNPERINPKEMLIAALQQIEREVAEVMVEDMGRGQIKVRVMNHEKLVYIDDVESLWEINLKLREVFRFFEKYLPPQKDVRAIEYAAVNGALSTLDPHSVLLKPDQFSEMKTSTKGEFGGLGIVISVRDGKLTIISPLDNTPASRAGLLALDVIARIGDESTVSMPIEEAVNRLRGVEGSKVTIWIERKGWPEARKFTLTRERIKIESVEGRMLSDNVGYIKIKNFQQNTGKDLEDKLAALQEQAGGASKLKGLVLDLRNNPGGLLEQAIRVSDKFLTSGDIVTTVGYGNKLREPKKARWSGTEADLPVAVLVNNGSASASEIVAGALKNLDRAVIIGERTFGKGSVQVLYDFTDNSALKLTIAQYLTPGGVSIQNVGVSPDVELKAARIDKDAQKDPTRPVRLFYEPDNHRENSLDKHLDRASDGPTGPVDADAIAHITYAQNDIEEPPGDDEEVVTPKSEDDFSMKLARDFLLAVGNASREKMIKAAGPFLAERNRGEEKHIEDKLSAFGVDWSDAPSGLSFDKSSGPKAEVEMKVMGTGRPCAPGTACPESNLGGSAPDQVVAGTDIKIEATVKNVGSAPFYRLRGMLDSEHPAFKGRELLFGKIMPGESKSWIIPTKIPKDAASRSDLVRLKLEAVGGLRGEEAQIPVVTRHVAHPQFAYTYVIDDSKRGDGDGVLEAGEGVDFVVFVSNTGAGDADEVSVRLKNGAGEDLFLERGRADIGAIKSGETKSGRLRFRVRKNQSPTRTGLPLELTIYDQGTNEWMEDQFAIACEVKKATTLAKSSGGVITKHDQTLVLGSASETADIVAVAQKNIKFASSAKVGDYVRVDLADEVYGWIRAADVRAAPKPKAPPTGKQLAYEPRRRQPTIKLDGEVGESLVDVDTVSLSGTVNARALRDLYVLLNDKKVLFASGPSLVEKTESDPSLGGASNTTRDPTPPPVKLASEWQEPNESAVTLPFRVDLHLKEGLNRVLVVARLDEKVVSYRNLFVTRRKAPASFVAEAPRESKPPAAKNVPPKAN
jgi:carboxyl-terminal processing protease